CIFDIFQNKDDLGEREGKQQSAFLILQILFRDILSRICFCSIARRPEVKSQMYGGNHLQLTRMIAIEPSNIMLTQAFGNNFHFLIKSIEEEPHLAPIVQPEDSDNIC
uniref:Ras-associating domain-containing protein n=1 Tax=Elaeophora elaphi TaxID=1147741 RepID=A0A0R3S2D9_9BILA